MRPTHLFVYGTLQSRFSNPYARRLQAGASLVGPATLPGLLYEIDGYPGAIWDENCGGSVHGELWRIGAEAKKLLARLDRYEECTHDFPAPHEYRREVARVTTRQGELIEAWVWLYNRPLDDLKPIPGGTYAERR